MPTLIRHRHHRNLSRDFLCKALSALYGKLTKPGKTRVIFTGYGDETQLRGEATARLSQLTPI